MPPKLSCELVFPLWSGFSALSTSWVLRVGSTHLLHAHMDLNSFLRSLGPLPLIRLCSPRKSHFQEATTTPPPLVPMFIGSLVNYVAKNKFELLIPSAGITDVGHYTQHPGVLISETDGISSYGFDIHA